MAADGSGTAPPPIPVLVTTTRVAVADGRAPGVLTADDPPGASDEVASFWRASLACCARNAAACAFNIWGFSSAGDFRGGALSALPAPDHPPVFPAVDPGVVAAPSDRFAGVSDDPPPSPLDDPSFAEGRSPNRPMAIHQPGRRSPCTSRRPRPLPGAGTRCDGWSQKARFNSESVKGTLQPPKYFKKPAAEAQSPEPSGVSRGDTSNRRLARTRARCGACSASFRAACRTCFRQVRTRTSRSLVETKSNPRQPRRAPDLARATVDDPILTSFSLRIISQAMRAARAAVWTPNAAPRG